MWGSTDKLLDKKRGKRDWLEKYYESWRSRHHDEQGEDRFLDWRTFNDDRSTTIDPLSSFVPLRKIRIKEREKETRSIANIFSSFHHWNRRRRGLSRCLVLLQSWNFYRRIGRSRTRSNLSNTNNTEKNIWKRYIFVPLSFCFVFVCVLVLVLLVFFFGLLHCSHKIDLIYFKDKKNRFLLSY